MAQDGTMPEKKKGDWIFLLENIKNVQYKEGVEFALELVQALYFREVDTEDSDGFWKEIKRNCCDGKSSEIFLSVALSRCIDSRKKDEIVLNPQRFVSLIHLIHLVVGRTDVEQYERLVNLALNEAMLLWDKDEVVPIVAKEINSLKWFILAHEEQKDTVNHMFINHAINWLAEQAKRQEGMMSIGAEETEEPD